MIREKRFWKTNCSVLSKRNFHACYMAFRQQARTKKSRLWTCFEIPGPLLACVRLYLSRVYACHCSGCELMSPCFSTGSVQSVVFRLQVHGMTNKESGLAVPPAGVCVCRSV